MSQKTAEKHSSSKISFAGSKTNKIVFKTNPATYCRLKPIKTVVIVSLA